eukprot:6029663-Alexandrium_andersonii.AAC.1
MSEARGINDLPGVDDARLRLARLVPLEHAIGVQTDEQVVLRVSDVAAGVRPRAQLALLVPPIVEGLGGGHLEHCRGRTP